MARTTRKLDNALDIFAQAAERRMIMANCRQACQYNTLYGCKVKEYNAICPLTNMATPITEYKMTNSDRIRSMSDDELAEFIFLSPEMEFEVCRFCEYGNPTPQDDWGICLNESGCFANSRAEAFKEWLKQPAE